MLERVEAYADHIEPCQDVNWNVVRIIVEKYRERHFDEFEGCLEYVKQQRAGLQNKFAVGKSESSMRKVFSLPPNLEFALSKKYPLVFRGENLWKFLKMFPFFQIPDSL